MTTHSLHWTDPALAGLERYFTMRLAPDALDGADPQELRADLKAHLEEELGQAGITVVTLEHLRLALAKMGEPLPLETRPPPETAAPFSHQIFEAPKTEGALRHPAWFLLCSVVLPLGTFLFEVVTRGGAGLFFDPMPDIWHHLMVLTVPAAGFLFWKAQHSEASPRLKRALPWFLGAAGVFAGFYALCFLPIFPLAVPGILFYGLGIFPLVPLLAFAALWRARVLLKRGSGGHAKRPLQWGGRVAFVLIALLELPVLLTQVGLRKAMTADADSESLAAAVRFCRRFGSETALLKSCYEPEFRMSFSPIQDGPGAWLAQGLNLLWPKRIASQMSLPEVSRDLFYRVTGKSFSDFPRPSGYRPMLFTSFNSERNFQLDGDRGGTRVAGRIDGLSLAEGRMDWHCEQASGLTWGEWTLTFSNSTGQPEEARCRMALPPGGFVSRVTLWVDGKPEEAAYSTVSKVRAAYQSVAVVQRRDPVLVTQPDAGSILVQAFPVPAQGTLKTRITFTVPAGVDGKVWLPSIVERNFDFPSNAAYPIWVQTDHGTLTLPADMQPHPAMEAGAPTVTGSLPLASLTGNGASFTWTHQEAPVVYALDPFAAADRRLVVHQAGAPLAIQPRAIAWVIDTSASLKEAADMISSAISALSPPGASAVFLPGDAPQELQTLTDFSKVSPAYAGGRDNTPALAAALDWMRGHPEACLIWIHGPQAASETTRSALNQLLERSAVSFTLMDVPLVPGENRLSSLFAAVPRITCLPVRHSGADLSASIRSGFQQRGGSFRTLAEGTPPPDGAVKTSDTLARWFARREASRLALTDYTAASALAASHQIVSPWSGAVVLEKASDYDQHGLKQADAPVAQQIPVVPEPSGVVLILLSSLPLLLGRRRPR